MRLIVGVTGASGVEMSYYLLKALKKEKDCEIHLIVSRGAELTWGLESRLPLQALTELADAVYGEEELAAVISSGSFVTDGMVILPCSMKTLAGIASGYAENLILRAADVCLKEGRKVVLVPREMPFGRIHLRNMLEAAEYGCVIVPPVLTFYNGGETLEQQIDHIVGKILMQFHISYDRFVPWAEGQKRKRPVSNPAEQEQNILRGVQKEQKRDRSECSGSGESREEYKTGFGRKVPEKAPDGKAFESRHREPEKGRSRT